MKRLLALTVMVVSLALSSCGAGGQSHVAADAPTQTSVEMATPAEEWQKYACVVGGGARAALREQAGCPELDQAANALQVDVAAPHIGRFREIWRRVYEPYLSLTGREATLRLVPGAAMKGTPAMICAGPSPTVYFSTDIVEQTLVQAKYPESFLAFIAGHELGHRLDDYTCEGFTTSSGEDGREVLADLRAAYFTTVAGFSTLELAEDRIVDDFLKMEAQLGSKDRKKRRTALKEALESYPRYEALYQNAISLSFADDEELVAAARLVGWADELMTIESVPVPEFKLLRAVILMRSAIPHATWMDKVGRLSPSANHLRCSPVMATHTAFHEDIKPGDALIGPKPRSIDERQRAVANLELALQWVNYAESQFGANPLIASNLRSCIQFYLEEPGIALAEHERAMRAAQEHAGSSELPASLKKAMEANRALFEFEAFLMKNKRPSDGAKLTAWQRELAASNDEFSAHPGVALVIAEVMGKPAPASDETSAGEADASIAPVLAGAGLPQTELSSALGECPDGTQPAAVLPDPDSAEKSGTHYGITFCRPAGEGRVSMISRVRLVLARKPVDEEVRIDILAVEPSEGSTVQSMVARCPSLEPRSVAPDGAQVWSGSCDGEDETVIYTFGETIDRIDVLRRAKKVE